MKMICPSKSILLMINSRELIGRISNYLGDDYRGGFDDDSGLVMVTLITKSDQSLRLTIMNKGPLSLSAESENRCLQCLH